MSDATGIAHIYICDTHLTHMAHAAKPALGVGADVTVCPPLLGEEQLSCAVPTSMYM